MEHISEIAKAQQPGEDWYTPPENGQKPVERVTLGQLDASHHPKVAKAIQAAHAWQSRKIGGQGNAALVLVAKGMTRADGKADLDRTGYGVGKTHIAKALQWASCYYLDDEPIAPAGMFYTAQDILKRVGDELMSEIAPPRSDKRPGTPVLVVDDVGSEGVLSYVAHQAQEMERHARYFQIFDYCYKSERNISVVVTANLSLDELAQWVGGRAWSRLQEMAPAGFMLDLTGVPDYRRRRAGR